MSCNQNKSENTNNCATSLENASGQLNLQHCYIVTEWSKIMEHILQDLYTDQVHILSVFVLKIG